MSRPMKQALITLLLLGTAFSQSGRIVRHTLGGGHKIEVQQDTTSPVTAITSPANSATVTSGIYCSNFLEGLTSLPCWDTSTLSFYSNVLVGRAAAQWTVAGTTLNCPSPGCGSFPNFVPAGGGPGGAGGGVNCSGSPTVNCMGYTGFEGGSPTVTFPTGPCVYDGSDPTDCPLMALPWSNNFTLSDVAYDAASSYKTEGVDTSKVTDAMTKGKYVCPTGANCGSTGPFQD